MEGLCHSLTARRIDKLAIRRHVEGLREIEMLIEDNSNWLFKIGLQHDFINLITYNKIMKQYSR